MATPTPATATQKQSVQNLLGAFQPDANTPAEVSALDNIKAQFDPTIAGSNVRRYTPSTGSYNSAVGDYYKNLETSVSSSDEAGIRSAAQQAVQAQVDAIDNTYVGILANERQAGQVRLGQTRATQARSGNLGSDFGDQALGTTGQYNDEQIAALNAEKANKIAAIFAGANQRADETIAKRKSDAAANSKAYIDHLSTVAEAAKGDLVNLAKSGVSLDELTDEEYQKLLDQSGYTPEQAKAAMVLNKPQATVLSSFTQGNKYYTISQDPITKKITNDVVDLGFSVPEEYTSVKMGDNTVAFYPKKIDPSKPISEQILTYSVGGGSSGDSGITNPSSPNYVPTWDAYLKAAQNVAGMEFNAEGSSYKDLKAQYDKTYGDKQTALANGGKTAGDFTPTEKRKLEQGGLLNAPRQQQLDYLYKDNSDSDNPF